MALQVGDVLRLRMVGTVTDLGGGSVTMRTASGTDVAFPTAIGNDVGFAWEVQAAPEPAYEAGALYTDADGGVYARTALASPGDRWQVLVHPGLPLGRYVGEGVPVRPLRKLVPEP